MICSHLFYSFDAYFPRYFAVKILILQRIIFINLSLGASDAS